MYAVETESAYSSLGQAILFAAKTLQTLIALLTPILLDTCCYHPIASKKFGLFEKHVPLNLKSTSDNFLTALYYCSNFSMKKGVQVS